MDYYKVLEINPPATRDDLDKAYRRMVVKWHPDRHPVEKKAHAREVFKNIGEAYRILIGEQHNTETDYRYQYRDAAVEDLFRDFFEQVDRATAGMNDYYKRRNKRYTAEQEGRMYEGAPCPMECGGRLVKRRNRKTGEEFLGCSNYPKCKGY